MPGRDQGRELVGQSVRIPFLGRQQVEQIARCGFRCPLAAFGDQPPDQRHPAATKAPPCQFARAGDRQGQQKIEEARPAETLGIAGDQFAQFRPVTIHGQRKHRPAGDLEGEELHLGEQIEGAPAAIREPADQSAGRLRDVTRQHRDRPRRECRRNGLPLMPPILAFAEQEALAEQGAQHPDRGRGAAVICRVVDEDVVDARGPAEDDLPPAEEAADHHLFLEGLGREGQQRILPQRPRDAASPRTTRPEHEPPAGTSRALR